MEKITFKDLGCISYRDAWDLQQSLMDGLIRDKLELRQLAKAGTLPEMTPVRNHQLLFCEHRPVFTLGKSGSADHLLMSAPALEELGFEFFKINRGGDITYHGPGQLVAYPIFDLDGFFSDVHRYVRYLEEVVIRTLSTYGLAGVRSDGFTGVWLEPDGNRPMRKICAIGVHL
ncbi:MAG: lipoyl(octanoyl) transferase LipB, partial [Saprospiraceae bacterium]|nr:lipoyl(octanoyl) transferase LipB [Saprospiraceae bacterium]